MSAKADRARAERAAEWWVRECMNCVVTRRALRTKYAKVDMFAADVMGKREDGSMVFAQATAGQDSAVTARHRKLEAIPWAPHDRVFVLQLRSAPNPANRRRLQYFFRVMEYSIAEWYVGTGVQRQVIAAGVPKRQWRNWDQAHEIDRAWFKAA